MNIDLSEANYIEILGALIGICIVIAGNSQRIRLQKLLRHGQRVDGEVIEIIEKIERGADNRFTSTYYPVIRFEANNGPVAEKYDMISSNPCIYKQWQTVPVIYDPVNNKNFIVENTGSKIAAPVLMVVGFVIIIAAIVFYIFDPQSVIRF